MLDKAPSEVCYGLEWEKWGVKAGTDGIVRQGGTWRERVSL